MGCAGIKKQNVFGKQNLCVSWLKQKVAIKHILLNVNGREQMLCSCNPKSMSDSVSKTLFFVSETGVSDTG